MEEIREFAWRLVGLLEGKEETGPLRCHLVIYCWLWNPLAINLNELPWSQRSCVSSLTRALHLFSVCEGWQSVGFLLFLLLLDQRLPSTWGRKIPRQAEVWGYWFISASDVCIE